MSETKLEYQKLIEENNIIFSELPQEIRNRIKSMSGIIGMYNKHKTEKLYKSITEKDIEIANLIQNHLEQDLPDDSGADGDGDAGDGKKTPPAAQKQPQKQYQVEDSGDGDDNDEGDEGDAGDGDDEEDQAEEMARRAAQQRQRNAQLSAAAAAKVKEAASAQSAAAAKAQEEADAKDPVKQIMSKLNKENRISTGELKAIIGRTPDYPREIVGTLVLEKAFMSPYYKLIKQ